MIKSTNMISDLVAFVTVQVAHLDCYVSAARGRYLK